MAFLVYSTKTLQGGHWTPLCSSPLNVMQWLWLSFQLLEYQLNFIFNSFLQGIEFCINILCASVYTENPHGVLCIVITIIIVLNLLLPVSQEIRNKRHSVTRKFLTDMRFGRVYINVMLTFDLYWTDFFFPMYFVFLVQFFFSHDPDICSFC